MIYVSAHSVLLRRVRTLTLSLVCSALITCAHARTASAQVPTPADPSQASPATAPAPSTAAVPTDLDAFMARVLERRADNWRRLRDYILSEKERFDLIGPLQMPLYGIRREFTWYMRDGFLVRSPIKFDGVTLSDTARREYEDKWLREERSREERRRSKSPAQPDAATVADPGASDPAAIVRQAAAEPRFISESYFLTFKFEPGNYYLVGRETFENRDVLKIEYYPTHLFKDDDDEGETRSRERGDTKQPSATSEETTDQKASQQQQPQQSKKRQSREIRLDEKNIERQMNKVALVTLWVDPAEHQVVKFTFDNIDFGFLPLKPLMRLGDISASMVMGQPLDGIWLPREITMHASVTLATGSYQGEYAREFYDYRQGDVKSRIHRMDPKD